MDPNASDRGAEGTAKPSKLEAVKLASQYLKVQDADELNNGQTHFSEDAANVLKFHGSYQQDDRDLRTLLRKEGKERAYSLMVRLRMPGGRITSAEQYLACAELARTVGNSLLRITTRQELQLYKVRKDDLARTIRRINEVRLTTLSACGDVARNVLCCPAPLRDGVHDAMQADADAWAAHAAPRTPAYRAIWLRGETTVVVPAPESLGVRIPTPGDDTVEPVYGRAYLPRKFKTAFALPEDNCVDIHVNDLGFLAVVEGGVLQGYNVLVGGGLGTTPSAQKTFPALARPLGYVDRADVLRVGEAIVKVFRDFGNRCDRKRARLKYLIHDWGMLTFRAKVEEYLGQRLDDPKPVAVSDVDDHLGWREQGDGKLFLGIPVENGRILDDGPRRLFSGLEAFFRRYETPARLTCQKAILLSDLDPSWKGDIEAWLAEYGIATAEQVPTVRRWSMACPVFPNCGLAVTEAERALPSVLDGIEEKLARLDLQGERFTVRMTGCPNGCARPYIADIGLVGRSATRNPDGTPGPGTYTVFLGGRTTGERLNVEFKDYVPQDQIAGELSRVFGRFQTERRSGENFGDFCHRVGVADL